MAQKRRSKNGVKRLKISPEKAIFLSAGILALCICMLCVSIFVSMPRSDDALTAGSSRNKTAAHTEKSVRQEKTEAPESRSAAKKIPEKTEPVSAKKAPEKSSAGTVAPAKKNVPSEKKTDSESPAAVPQKKDAVPAVAKRTTPPEVPVQPKPAVPAVPEKPPVAPGSSGTVILIFDDAGNNLGQLVPYLAIPCPITVAVLPGLAASAEAAAKVRAAGKEVMLHQPMQALDLSINPGPGAITPDMNVFEIQQIVRNNIASIGPVAGMNNHEGSLITGSAWAIGAVLDVCMEKNIYFIDSRTSGASKVREAAAERSFTIWERNIFIDNSPKKEDMLAEINKGLEIAKKSGFVIMIGHVRPFGLAQLVTEHCPEWIKDGYAFKTISQIR